MTEAKADALIRNALRRRPTIPPSPILGRTDHSRWQYNDESHPEEDKLNRRNFLFPFLYFLCLVALALIVESARNPVSLDSIDRDLIFNTLVVAWLLIWMAVGRLLAHFRLRYLGLWGATIHVLYIYSEMLYGQALGLSLSPAALVSLAGIGIVLLPLGSRFTRFVALPLFTVATVVLVSFPLINIGNFWLTGTSIPPDAIYAIFQTNLSELLQFLGSSYSTIRLAVVFGSIALCIGIILWKLTTVATSPSVAGLGLLLLLPVTVNVQKVPEYLYTLSLWHETFIAYGDIIEDWQELKSARDAAIRSYGLGRAPGADRATVLVIGESHNKQHMSLYGYPRENTPMLDQRAKQENLIVFENAWSNHTHTNPSLSYALTETNQYNGKRWTATPSLPAVARRAGIATWWISNQQMLGAWDNHVAMLAKESDNITSINTRIGTWDTTPDKQDEALIPHLQDALRQPGEKLIIVHLYGNHGNYCRRYPKSWEFYSGELELSVFGKASATTHLEEVNCYDNSIQYNDFVLDQIFDSLENSDIPASAFYFADHSEEIFEGKSHNSGNFDFAMSDIPMVFAASDSWKEEFPVRWKQLINNRKKIFTNDLVFETVLGLMGVEGAGIDTKNDLGSEDYEGIYAPETLHGRVKLKDERNYYLWQRINSDLVRENNLGIRLLPHRVNTIGKMIEIHKAGLRSYEIDVLFRHTMIGEGYFEVGHDDHGAMTGMSLETWLEQMPGDFEKIWLDIKNVTTAEIPEINKRLLDLDQKNGLKNRVIIETDNVSAKASLFAESGFHLSYYLPTKKVLDAMSEDDNVRQNMAKKLAGIAKKQGVSAVSFDLRLYAFVKGYLEPKLPPRTVYHTWSFENSFRNPTLLEDLQTQGYFHDPAVQTILLPWESPYHL